MSIGIIRMECNALIVILIIFTNKLFRFLVYRIALAGTGCAKQDTIPLKRRLITRVESNRYVFVGSSRRILRSVRPVILSIQEQKVFGLFDFITGRQVSLIFRESIRFVERRMPYSRFLMRHILIRIIKIRRETIHKSYQLRSIHHGNNGR